MSIVQPIARPIVQPITRPITAPSTGSAWSPARLFTASEPGIAYDLTDKTKLYQDSARTTLVSANGDPIGSATDLSGNGKHASQATTASKPLFQGYADFDGVDDNLATAAINFTNTGVMTVVASIRKGSDATLGLLAELGTGGQAGSFFVSAPTSAGQPTYGANYTGATSGRTQVSAASYAAPHLAVVNSSGILATGEIELRVNGTLTESTAGVGGGTFGNYPLSIGRRSNGTLLFTGRIYRMIVIGRTLTAAELSRAEAWCAAPAGVVLP